MIQVSFNHVCCLLIQLNHSVFHLIGLPGANGLPGMPGAKGEPVRVDVREQSILLS